MRSRFLATDYFFSQSPNETLKDFKFLSLSPPSPSIPSPFDAEIPFFDLDLDLDLSSEIDRFPIENALSQFLSDVIPRFQPAGARSSIGTGSQKRRGASEIGLSDEMADFTQEVLAIEKFSDLRSDASLATVFEGSRLQKEIRFEIAEVELPLKESASSCEEEQTSLCFKLQDIKIPLDIINIEAGISITYPYNVANSIYKVDDTPAKFGGERNSSSAKDNCSSADATLNCAMTVPLFEVFENGWELGGSLFKTDTFNFLLPGIESWHGAQGNELVVDAKEFLRSTDIDILEQFSGDPPSEHGPCNEPISLDSVLDMDFINLNGNFLLDRSCVMYPITPDGECSQLPCSIHLQEVQIFDIPSDDVFQVFVNSQRAMKPDMSELMFEDHMDFGGGLYESVISSELTLVDDMFKSLPTPILSDDKALRSLRMLFRDILSALKQRPLSASDGIYLDWHPLLEGACNRAICSTYMKILEEVSSYMMTNELQTDWEELVAIDIDFLDDNPETKYVPCHEEVPAGLDNRVPQASYPSAKPETTQMLNNGANRDNDAERIQKRNPDKISFLFESMSQSSDLNFFLDVRRGTMRRNCGDETIKRDSSKVTQPTVPPEELSAKCVSPKEGSWQWHIENYPVVLTADILELINHLHKSYLAFLEGCKSSKKSSLFPFASDIELQSLSKQKLLHLIIQICPKKFTLGSQDEDAMAFMMLYAIKQMACYLCFFGVDSAYLYISNLTKSIDNMAERLRSLESLIENACQKAKKQSIDSHPSLAHIERVLRLNTRATEKILVVADRVFWLPLTQKLTSMNIKSHEVRQALTPANQLDTSENIKFTNSILEALLHSDCLLITQESITASFPFNKFDIILEYGGPSGSSRLSPISPNNSDGLPRLHFFHVEMDNHNLPVTLCEGYDIPQNLKSRMEIVSQDNPNLEGSNYIQHVLAILNFVPTNCSTSASANQEDASLDNESISNPYSVTSKNVNSSMPSLPDVVIIVNTQTFEKKMLMSRRTSYQKILAMEKGGVQVVEREINLPLDLIFSAAVCLVWYEAQSYGDNIAAKLEASSITVFMENIATNILMSLSFAFSGCILIFEGESSFLAAIMESSDALYAAAASLDMNLQLFCSYMPESTDEIILNCIRNETRLDRGLYAAMPESETLGESFLTRFPSIHPLSAHAILSSGGMLVEFLAWSHEHRIQATEKYHIANESISLFSALCRYGEMGESKSVMTECSSIDSDISSGLLQSPSKRQRHYSRTFLMAADNPSLVEPLNQTIHDIELPQTFQPYQLRNFSNIQNILKKTERNKYDGISGSGQGVKTSKISNHYRNDPIGCEHLDKNYSGEVVDHDFAFLDRNVPLMSDCFDFLERPETRHEPAARSSLPMRTRALSANNCCTFPTSAEINHSTNKWIYPMGHNSQMEDKTFGKTAISSSKVDPLVNFMHDRTRNIIGSSTQGKEPQLHGEHPHSHGTQLSKQQQSPHWTIEFLHRAKEKGRMHQQNLSCNTCLNCTRGSKNQGTPCKTLSPSIIDSFRHQGGSQLKKTANQKCRKDAKAQQTLSSDKRKNSSSIPTWTPVDKRARQNLSFTRNGNERQSKLVWRNKNSPGISCSLRKRYREEG